MFVEGSIRPEGDLKESIDSILERFPDGDQVGDELIKSINESAREDGEDFTYEAASEALGEGSSLALLVEMEPIVDLVESTGQDDADFQEAKPYLEAFDLFASGIESSGETETQRFVVRFSD